MSQDRVGDLTERLKGCPFCGSHGWVGTHAEVQNMWIAGCEDADCIGNMAAYDFVSRETAIAAWNRRSPDPEASSRIEELTRALEEARDLLLERRQGSAVRAAGHNARLVIEAALSFKDKASS